MMRTRRPSASRGPRRSARPILESLEDRQLLSTFTVENTNDSGAGSLRFEIGQAFTTTGANAIIFDPTVFSTPQTITLTSGQLNLSNTGGTDMITGPAAGVTISGGLKSAVLQVHTGVTATLSGLTITDGENLGGGDGGGVINDGTATLTGCTINNNFARYSGGGVFNSGTATLTDCTISGNSSIDAGAAVFSDGTATLNGCAISGNVAVGGIGDPSQDAVDGGGVVANFGTATVSNCTISGNSAVWGGGMLNETGQATLTNCTISGNSANWGGGILNETGQATLIHCTISGNSASSGGGGVYNVAGSASGGGTTVPFGPVTLNDTIVAGNTAQSGPSDIGGDEAAAVTGSYNLIGTGGSGGVVNGVSGNIVLTSLAQLDLGPLASNGGPTETMALLPGSAAIQHGAQADYPGTTTPITTDQRGDPLDVPPDIGAYQIAPTPTPTPVALVTVESLQVETIKVGVKKRAKKMKVLVLHFSGALNASAADNANAYDLAPIVKVKASGKGKNRKPATTKLGPLVAVASANYNASNNSVTLTPRRKLKGSKPRELIVNGMLLTDTLGREIDGSDDGQPGSDYIATIRRAQVTVGGIPI